MLYSHLICNLEKNKRYLDHLEIFTLILSALCHDVGHTGHTNIFQINSQTQLALIYNDKSPLQNYHIAKTFQILRYDNANILNQLKNKRQSYKHFRQYFISNILFTDIQQHFPLLSSFNSRVSAQDFGNSKHDKKLLTGTILHSSDFAGSVNTFQISKQWSLRVNKQFSAQFHLQGLIGIPQTSYMKDLDKIDVIAKGEIEFLKVIVRPLYKQLNDFYQNNLKEQLDNLDNSILEWQKIYEENGHVDQMSKIVKKRKQSTNQKIQQQQQQYND